MPDNVKEALWQMEQKAIEANEQADKHHKRGFVNFEMEARTRAETYRICQNMIRKAFGL